ncbi:cation transporter [Actinomycetaceae bacterium TAE3-ERU4]|nr:cation transporter [Actinomycetaceae bacterium TAE3-ERU4]
MSVFPSTIELDVVGMTCGKCVAHVREELEELSGIGNIDVILDSKGVSVVTVVENSPVSDDDLRAAVDEAGYKVTEIRRDSVA